MLASWVINEKAAVQKSRVAHVPTGETLMTRHLDTSSWGLFISKDVDRSQPHGVKPAMNATGVSPDQPDRALARLGMACHTKNA